MFAICFLYLSKILLCDAAKFLLRLLPSGHDEEAPGSEIADPADDALLLQEEEYKRKIELEAEERKLEETLEYQRRIENEAKQKHLAEQQRKNSKIAEEKEEPIAIADSYSRHNDNGKDVNGQWTNKKVRLQSHSINSHLEKTAFVPAPKSFILFPKYEK